MSAPSIQRSSSIPNLYQEQAPIQRSHSAPNVFQCNSPSNKDPKSGMDSFYEATVGLGKLVNALDTRYRSEKIHTLITRIALVAMAITILGATIAASILNPPAIPAIVFIGSSALAFLTLIFGLTFL